MRSWSDSPFARAVAPADVPEGGIVASDKGESQRVYEIAGRSGWLAKVYERPLPEEDAARLERLIALPGSMTAAERAVVDRHTCWPVASIAGGGGTTGVVMAQAPERFFVRMRGVTGELKAPEPLLLDWLAAPPQQAAERGLGTIGPGVRARATRETLAVGALFEKHGLVYADWSYDSAFWQLGVGSVFVIDLDTCGMGTRAWVEAPGWHDPLYPDGSAPLTPYSDRYKLAVLAVRCLTGLRRDPLDAYARLDVRMRQSAFGVTLGRILTATEPAARPTVAELLRACGESGLGNSWSAGPPPAADGARGMGTGRTGARPGGGDATGSVPVGGRAGIAGAGGPPPFPPPRTGPAPPPRFVPPPRPPVPRRTLPVVVTAPDELKAALRKFILGVGIAVGVLILLQMLL